LGLWGDNLGLVGETIDPYNVRKRIERDADMSKPTNPASIKTKAENEAFLAIVEELMHRSNPTPEEDALLDLLVKLIEDFEAKHYHLDISTPRSRLLHLMEARSLNVDDLAPIIGDRASLILSENAEISIEDAIALAPFFHVKPELLLK
jgi:HTH-type transcriptional regulator / antitoxin HigA